MESNKVIFLNKVDEVIRNNSCWIIELKYMLVFRKVIVKLRYWNMAKIKFQIDARSSLLIGRPIRSWVWHLNGTSLERGNENVQNKSLTRCKFNGCCGNLVIVRRSIRPSINYIMSGVLGGLGVSNSIESFAEFILLGTRGRRWRARFNVSKGFSQGWKLWHSFSN